MHAGFAWDVRTAAMLWLCFGAIGCLNVDSETRVNGNGGSNPSIHSTESCAQLPTVFEETVWGPVASQKCVTCHNAQGVARTTRMVLMEGSSEDVVARNLSVMSTVAKIQQSGSSLLLLKPSAQTPHGGGEKVTVGSPDYQALVDFVGRVEACSTSTPAQCNPTTTPARVRRLNRNEFNQTVLALVGDSTRPANAFPIDDKVNGYSNDAFALRVSPLLAEQLFDGAEGIAQRARSRGGLNSGCNVSTKGEATCAREFIKSFATNAFRRPATQAEQDGLYTVYQTGRNGGTYEEGMELVITAVVQSASFLYNTELGSPSTVSGQTLRLTPYELASALSYLLTGGPPDADLLASAAAGTLNSTTLEAQARRLLAKPEARAQLNAFFFQWLELDGLESLEKDATAHPSFNTQLRNSMKSELEDFISSVVFDKDKSLKSVLTSRESTVDATMAAFYGVSAPASGTKRAVTLNAAQRSGLLTRPGVMALFAQQIDSSPIRRGKLVRTRVLCEPLPPPPEDLKIVFPAQEPSKTTRQRFAQHATNTACKGCHALMDPVGFGFENYNAIGAYRATENGLPIDNSGEMLGTHDTNGPFMGAAQLSERLADSAEVQECFSRHMMQFVQARPVETEDECTLAPTREKFAASGTNVTELLLQYALSDAFQVRSVMQ